MHDFLAPRAGIDGIDVERSSIPPNVSLVLA
jgi:hypothetical protein